MKKVLVILLSLFVGFSSLLQLSAYVHENYDYGNFPYIALVPPPPEALAADYGTPLVTTDIGLFAYYQESSWDLNDVIPAFHNYTQYSNYVDGYVRVYSNVKGTTFEGETYGHSATDPLYIDVQVRVRSDGWVLAWMDDTQPKGLILSWGDHCRRFDTDASSPINAIQTPDDYSTSVARAIHRVYHNAGVSWVGYDELFYYDYEFPDATRLFIFGDYIQAVFPNSNAETEHFYFVIPSSTSIEGAYLGYAGYNSSGDDVDLDGVDVGSVGGSTGIGWRSVDISGSINTDTKHDVKLDQGGSAQGEALACFVAIWTS